MMFDIRDESTWGSWLDAAGESALREALAAHDAGPVEVEGELVYPAAGVSLALVTGVQVWIDFARPESWPGRVSDAGYVIGEPLPENPVPKAARKVEE